MEIKLWENDGLASNTHQDQLLDKITIRPNPASEIIKIEGLASTSGPLKIMLINTIGKTVMTGSISNQDIKTKFILDVNQIPNGMYVLSIIGQTSTISRKVIIDHNQ